MPLPVTAFSTLSFWGAHVFDNDDALVEFVDSCLEKVVTFVAADGVVTISYRLDPSLYDIIGTDEVASRIERLVQSEYWSGEKKLAIQRFLRERDRSNSSQNP
jgi:hypothetical protein